MPQSVSLELMMTKLVNKPNTFLPIIGLLHYKPDNITSKQSRLLFQVLRAVKCTIAAAWLTVDVCSRMHWVFCNEKPQKLNDIIVKFTSV